MSTQVAHLYRVQKKDVPKVGVLLADSFREDPFWVKLHEGESWAKSDRIVSAFYQASVLHCLRYGEVHATSQKLEGVIAWVPGDLADMALGRQLRSGAFDKGMKAMLLLGGRSRTAMRAMAPVPPARQANMRGRSFVYLQVLGVATEHQGRGLGGKLLEALTDRSDQTKIPLYTETTLEKAVGVYERHGFRVINRIALPIVDLPLWEFVREPSP